MSGARTQRCGNRGGVWVAKMPVSSLPRDQLDSSNRTSPSSPSPWPSTFPHTYVQTCRNREPWLWASPGAAGASVAPGKSFTRFLRDEPYGRRNGNGHTPLDLFLHTSPWAVLSTQPSLPARNEERNAWKEMSWSGAPRHQILRPGMVLLKNYLAHDVQVDILSKCRVLGLGAGGFYRPSYQNGAKLSLWMMCLGKNWDPETKKYEYTRSYDGATPPPIPVTFKNLVAEAMRMAHQMIGETTIGSVEAELPGLSPDLCIVNFYRTTGKLGLHQDKDESRESLRKGLPVVSFSIGDSACFQYGDSRNGEDRVELESGDVLIFGGKSRHIFHGVTAIKKNSAPKWLVEESGLQPGRLNLTFRQY